MTHWSTTRRVLAVLAVTTALCADQTVMAASAPRAQNVEIGELASRWVSRLAQNFQRRLPSIIREPARQQQRTAAAALVIVTPLATPIELPTLSPFQFRLPPPTV